MARYKPVHRDPLLLPVVLAEQIQPGTFEFALDHLVDHELDLSALDARFRNDQTGASAYDPRVMLKIVLLAYSRGLITSRDIERACRRINHEFSTPQRASIMRALSESTRRFNEQVQH
jgi:transposase